MQALRFTTQHKLVWLTLLALLSVNNVLVWHDVAHAQLLIAVQQSDVAPQAPFQSGQHCDLCLSANGQSAGALSQFVLYLSSLLVVFLTALNPQLAPSLIRYRLRARSPPTLLA